MRKLVLLIIFFAAVTGFSQEIDRQQRFGSITPERAWWDLKHYDLKVRVDPATKSIAGTNTIRYEVLSEANRMQIDLQQPMTIDKVTQDGRELEVASEGMFHFITLDKKQHPGKEYELTIAFSGTPRVARRPPWDGGFTWDEDSNKKPFIATSNQGIGASIWWPNKDHPYDEPDNGTTLSITAPQELTAVGNGRLIDTVDKDRERTWIWEVKNPINNYGINVNIGDYMHFSETYQGENGTLDCDYWVLKENEEKARKQFNQVPMMLEAFEYWFGPYPFYEDSFKLVEVPYLGMEHQSSVTYGNGYLNGYRGSDLSGSGWGLKFDFIIIHEAGHEWFANNITNDDVADMWIHEGFTAYSENLYLDYHYGRQASSDYVTGTRKMITNDRPIIGTRDQRGRGSTDMYYKGANILHTLRQLLEDDEKWREILRGLNTEFRHQTVSSKQVEDYISEMSGIDLTEFWQQYLRTTMIPKLQFWTSDNTLYYKYDSIVEGFDMPVLLLINDKEHWIYPDSGWKAEEFPEVINTLSVKKDFYVDLEYVEQ